jgi:hypothetical protein
MTASPSMPTHPVAASEHAKLVLAQRFMMALGWLDCVDLELPG